MLYGYATDEWDTDTLSPLTLYLSNKLCETLSEMRRSGSISWLLPDCKSLVAIEYYTDKANNNKLIPIRVSHIIVEV